MSALVIYGVLKLFLQKRLTRTLIAPLCVFLYVACNQRDCVSKNAVCKSRHQFLGSFREG